MDQPGADSVDVAIVGCGPVGALLANLLGLCGISVRIVDRDTHAYTLPRAIHFDDEVMRVFQAAGLAASVHPKLHVSPGMKFVDATGRLLLDWSRPQTIGPQGWFASYRFHQPELEQALRAGLERFPHVTLHTGCEVVAIEQRDEGVAVRFRDTAGLPGEVQARYVVGCDGAKSMVRRAMGATLEDLGFRERWLVIDAMLLRPRPDLGDHSIQHCDPARPATYVRGTGDRRRWELSVLPGEDEAALTQPQRLRELLSPWVGPDDIRIERAVVYTFHSALADRWRRGPLLIAGDAAHLTPPFLGQGMCAGIRDAANLAWKLAAVLQGHSDPALLDSYGSERIPHVREYIELAIRLGGLINAKAMDAAVPHSVLEGGGPVRMASIKPRLGPGLAAPGVGAQGTLAPQPTLADGSLLDDHVGYGWALLLRPGGDAPFGSTVRGWVAARQGTVSQDPAVGPWLEAIGAVAAVIRPDRYVLGTAATMAELAALLAPAATVHQDAAD